MNIIEHPQFGEMRTEKHNGEFVFCAADICESLRMKQDAYSACQNLDEDEKLTLKTSCAGQKRDLLFVTESGLYALIIRSNKPEARKFRKWITSEVLPALRKYGTYSINEQVMNRSKIREDKKATKELMAEISKKLSATDKKLVAKQCLTTEYSVGRVLSCTVEDPTMAAMLYARATTSKALRKLFYTLEGSKTLINDLKADQEIKHPYANL